MVAVSLPVSVVRSTAPEPVSNVDVDVDVARVADTLNATEVAEVEAAAAAPRALRPDPGFGLGVAELPPPNAPPNAAAPKAMAAINEAMIVATARRRAPPDAGAPDAAGGVGPAGGSSAVAS